MPSGELEGTTLKLTTGREVADGHSHFPTGTTALELWLDKADNDPDLTDSIVEYYVRRRGTITMEEAIIDAPPRLKHMELSQDKIGWRRFLEGMIST
jgi:hypothetical protein